MLFLTVGGIRENNSCTLDKDILIFYLGLENLILLILSYPGCHMRDVHWLYWNSLLEDVKSTEISCFDPDRKILVQFENKASDVCKA